MPLNLRKRLAKLYSENPGIVINFLLIVGFSAYVLAHTQDEWAALNRHDRRIQRHLTAAIREIRSNTQSHVGDNWKRSDNDAIRTSLNATLGTLLDETHVPIIPIPLVRARKEQQDGIQLTALLDGLPLDRFLDEARNDSIPEERVVALVNEPISKWMIERSQYVHFEQQQYVWMILAGVYLLAVIGSRLAGVPLSNSNAAALNIIDVALYLMLAEYTGGFASPVLLAAVLAVCAALLELTRPSEQSPFVTVPLFLFALYLSLTWTAMHNATLNQGLTPLYVLGVSVIFSGAIIFCGWIAFLVAKGRADGNELGFEVQRG